MSAHRKVNLERCVEDMAPQFGVEGGPGVCASFGHRHEDQEAVHVVLSGNARIRVEDEIVDLEQWDATIDPGWWSD